MAIVDVSFNCGCGQIARTIEEARKHADAHKHVLTAFGTVRPTEPRKKVAKADRAPTPISLRPRTRKPAPVLDEEQLEPQVDFDSLRARLQRKLGA